MHKYKLSLIIAISSLVILSCSKSFLEAEDNSIILREQYVKDISTLQQYLNGIYVLMASDFFNGSPSKGGSQVYPEIVADNIKPSSTNTSTFIVQYTWNQTADYAKNYNLNAMWQMGYKLIRACNYTIAMVDDMKHESLEKANQISGEAHSLRAFLHFTLVNTFAQSYNFTADASHLGIPYITSEDWNDPFSRNSVKEVYDNMIKDLNIAIPLLTNSLNNKLIMNQYAAKALLARIYLFKEDWEKANSLAQEVTTAVPLLATAVYPDKLFTPDETEALFQLAPSSTKVVQGSYATTFQGAYFRSTAFLATKDIADLLTYNSADKRKAWISNGGMGKDSIRKYPIDVIPGFGTGASAAMSYFPTLFRSSEMFLTVAEASGKLGDESTARTYLDSIRQRADPSAPKTTATGTALLDSIYLERRKELAFEGLRMFDLLRWKKGVNRNDATIGAPFVLPYPSNKAIPPLPVQDIDYGLPQNPSY